MLKMGWLRRSRFIIVLTDRIVDEGFMNMWIESISIKSNLSCYFRRKIVLNINKKLSIPQILFTAFFVATSITVSDSFIEWDKPIYHGIYAGVLFIVGVVFAKVIFKDK
jgi:hypothetical protein